MTISPNIEALIRRLRPNASASKNQSVEYLSACASVCKSCDNLGYKFAADYRPGSQSYICECIKSCVDCAGAAQKINSDKRIQSCFAMNPFNFVRQFNQSHIPFRYIQADWKSMLAQSRQQQWVASTKKWLDNLQNQTDKGLIFHGDVGVGKTHLLCALGIEILKKGFSVKFIDFFQLLTELKAAYADGKSDPEILRPLQKVDVLIIDELGKGRASEWELSVADMLISERYNAKKIILASTNYSPFEGAKIEKFVNRELDSPFANSDPQVQFGLLETRVGKRILSRLCEMTHFVEIKGDDRRRRSRI